MPGGSRNVLVVVAHSDDEALGCGGALARHAETGDTVRAISMTDGVGSRDGANDDGIQRRRAAAAESARVLGFEWLEPGAFPDNAMDTVPLLDVAKLVEAAATRVEPDLIYTHHGGDLNVDHRVAFQAVLTAFRPVPGAKPVEIRSFEVASSTEWSHAAIGPQFDPDLYIGIAGTWDKKQASLNAYAEEMRESPHPRSVEGLRHLAATRGHQVGLPLAEAFVTIRRVVP